VIILHVDLSSSCDGDICVGASCVQNFKDGSMGITELPAWNEAVEN
jgi:hypothetical protein